MNALAAIAGTEARAMFATRASLVTVATLTIVRFGVVTLIYMAAFAALGGTVRDVSLSTAVWSMGFYFLLLGWNLRHIAKDIRDDVRSGAIEVRLIRPRSYLALVTAARTGKGLPELLIATCAVIAVAWLAVGAPPVPADPVWAVAAVALAIGSSVLTILMYALIGLSAIWLEESEPVYWLVDKSLMLLGGAFMPVALFPGWLAAVATWTPLGLAMAFPRVIALHTPAQLAPIFLAQAIWILVLAGALELTWRRAERRISVNGG